MIELPLPAELDGARVIAYAAIAGARATGHTIHSSSAGELLAPYGIAICQYSNGEGWYLFYCDKQWNVLTDTFHLTQEAARNRPRCKGPWSV